MIIYHDSRDGQYRMPYGAVTVDTPVTIRLRVEEVTPSAVYLRTWVDGRGERLIAMRVSEAASYMYEAVLTPSSPCILWYSFRIAINDNETYYYGTDKNATGGAGLIYDSEPPSFQITVYKERKVPDWYKNGIIYQIFPDRFKRGDDYLDNAALDLSTHKNGPKRVLLESWDEPVDYKKDEKGRIVEWDFYGGTLSGIVEKLPYLRDLGVTIIYLNPIVEAASNHRYDTGDYMSVSPLLGGDEAFRTLCEKAREFGIRIILDGVYNHTGADSKYFNKYGNYDTVGAFGNHESPYRDWYYFKDDSYDGYESWWGVGDLPTLNKDNKEYRKLIRKSMTKFMKLGASGFRLDVADELSDDFIEKIKKNVTDELGDDGLVIGEVWEDASNKISYGVLRRYFLGTELDAVMNYPLRDGIIAFLNGHINAYNLAETVQSLKENYPKEAFYGNFNMLGSHDRIRILTALGDAPAEDTLSTEARRDFKLSPDKKDLATKRLWLALLFQMTMPGVPTIYYGDEAGLEGYSDPYNRAPYPYGHEDASIMGMYRNAIDIRKMDEEFTCGDMEISAYNDEVLTIKRWLNGKSFYIIINRGLFNAYDVELDVDYPYVSEMLTDRIIDVIGGKVKLTMMPASAAVLFNIDNSDYAKKMEEGCGVLCHITSLPNENGAGTIGQEAYKFVDFLKEYKQKYWQILPLLPVDEYGSPYAASSTFGCNMKLLDKSEAELRALYKCDKDNPRFYEYKVKNEHWLKSYAMFLTLSREFETTKWQEWPEDFRKYSDEQYDNELRSREADYYAYREYFFDITWCRLKEYANNAGISIIGDIPMFVAMDSADCWANQELFDLDENGYPNSVAGVPPDYFSEDGQKWGNPLYKWENHKKSDYAWFMQKFERMMHLYDYIRIDHFRGYEACFNIGADDLPKNGTWKQSPGEELLIKAHDTFGPLPFIAEDLGFITMPVKKLMKEFNLPGMSVLQFYDGDIMAYKCDADRIAYTGTHDNETLKGFVMSNLLDNGSLTDIEAESKCANLCEELLNKVYDSDAMVKIVPLQDVACLGDESRMNTPGETAGNWEWQASEKDIKKAGETLRKISAKKSQKT